jgi:hypothetical protein
MNRQTLKRFLRHVIRRDETWSIGIYTADAALNLRPSSQAHNPVLTAKDVTDVDAEFVADPFMIRQGDGWYMFFEVLNAKKDRGEIAFASSPDGHRWDYQQVVLEESFHLSYPYVFEWNQEYYMIPESCQAKEVRLYKASRFPDRWVFEKTLLKGSDYVDSSLIYFNQKWWMFTSSASEEILRLYSADDFLGDWTEHPQSPITPRQSHLARPAGRVVALNNRLIRFAQDCQDIYGRQVFAFEITELTPDTYVEREVHGGEPVLKPSARGWNAYGTHHIDLHHVDSNHAIACVDGRDQPVVKLFGLPLSLLLKFYRQQQSCQTKPVKIFLNFCFLLLALLELPAAELLIDAYATSRVSLARDRWDLERRPTRKQ